MGALVALGYVKEGGLWPTGSRDSCLGDHLLGIWRAPGQQWPEVEGTHDCWEQLFFRTVKRVL